MHSFLDLLNSFPDYLIYIVLGLSAFIENVFPPIPGDTITAFGAFLVGTKRLNFLGVFISTSLGSLFGFMFLFRIGSILGKRYFIRRDYRFFKARDIIKAEAWFRKYGYFIILFNRFFPGLRSVISLAGGISRLKTSKVMLLALISACVWNFLWISLGYTLGSNWGTMRDKMGYFMTRYNLTILVILGLGVLFLVVKRLIRKKRGTP
ncbi:MAG: DedA family protein [Desulfobacterales bacterium]|nr:DedA family protein [Desulfobacterales bacterium]